MVAWELHKKSKNRLPQVLSFIPFTFMRVAFDVVTIHKVKTETQTHAISIFGRKVKTELLFWHKEKELTRRQRSWWVKCREVRRPARPPRISKRRTSLAGSLSRTDCREEGEARRMSSVGCRQGRALISYLLSAAAGALAICRRDKRTCVTPKSKHWRRTRRLLSLQIKLIHPCQTTRAQVSYTQTKKIPNRI